MTKSLLIVESPTKTKTIGKFVGKNYIIKSSVGHIRDLPKSARTTATKARRKNAITATEKAQNAKSRFIDRLGVDPENHWQARYEIIPGKEAVVKELCTVAAKCDTIILATDLDREGEAIAWHLRQVIGGKDDKYQRIVFNEITASAIHEALKRPRKLNLNQIHAQQARRFLDRIVGFMVSPLLWTRIARGLSAGRVQSVALRILCEREQAIKCFVSEEYWTIGAKLLQAKQPIVFAVTHLQNKKFIPRDKQAVDQHLQILEKETFTVTNVIQKEVQKRPYPPFTTSTLQQAASTKLGFGIRKTMMLAQKLYEAGAITYMRTDSTSLSKEAIAAVRSYIREQYSPDYLPKSPNLFAKKSTAQEAHEAIRPTSVTRQFAEGDKDMQALYTLIRNQCIACQMTPARYFSTQIIVHSQANNYQLRAKGRKCVFDGFTKVLRVKEEEQLLPSVAMNDTLALDSLLDKQHFTIPPSRFTEASLVKELEKKSIGRPSTYVPIIYTLQQRQYVALKQKKFYVERVGEIVDMWLQRFFADLVRLDFTAEMEQSLDKISKGTLEWQAVLNDYYANLKHTVEALQGQKNATIECAKVAIPCPTCDSKMLLRYNGNDIFLGCSEYTNKTKPCRKSVGLELVSTTRNATATGAETVTHTKRCPICQAHIETFLATDGAHKLHICSNYPSCQHIDLEKGDFANQFPSIKCHKCNGMMLLKNGRFGKYYSCETCNTTRKAAADGTPAPVRMDPIAMPDLHCKQVDDYYILREGASGLFLTASKYPKHREARSPLIKELLPYKQTLEKRLQYLCLAPLVDPDGNDTILSFAKKNLDYYVSSVKDGKRTRFKVTFDTAAQRWL